MAGRAHLMNKLKKLEAILKKIASCLIAYSAGLDSTFLLKFAHNILGDKVLAVTAVSETYPKEELAQAKVITKDIGVRHKIIKTYELKDRKFIANTVNRCYFCKKELFSRLKILAKRHKLNFVVDATNLSDKKDTRPGNIAKAQFKIRSPLAEAGITKEEIRAFSKKLGLVTWNKPPMACLASRVPYGSRITPALLKRIHKAEAFLKKIGFEEVRVRDYNSTCRIEVARNNIHALLLKRNLVVENFKRLGYNYITIDLEGYRTGSMNEVLRKGKR